MKTLGSPQREGSPLPCSSQKTKVMSTAEIQGPQLSSQHLGSCLKPFKNQPQFTHNPPWLGEQVHMSRGYHLSKNRAEGRGPCTNLWI